MPYLSKDLSVMAYANGFTAWHYVTQDTASFKHDKEHFALVQAGNAGIDNAGYFNAAADMLRAGDELTCNVTGYDGKITIAKRVVTKVDGGVVEVARFI